MEVVGLDEDCQGLLPSLALKSFARRDLMQLDEAFLDLHVADLSEARHQSDQRDFPAQSLRDLLDDFFEVGLARWELL